MAPSFLFLFYRSCLFINLGDVMFSEGVGKEDFNKFAFQMCEVTGQILKQIADLKKQIEDFERRLENQEDLSQTLLKRVLSVATSHPVDEPQDPNQILIEDASEMQ